MGGKQLMMKSKSRNGAKGRMETFYLIGFSTTASIIGSHVLGQAQNFPLPSKVLNSQWKFFVENRYILREGSGACLT